MPEGDTVHLVARRLDRALADQVLVRTDFRVPALATVDLAGRVVRDVVARGKHILTRIDGGLTLHTHLKMEGAWHLYRPDRGRRGPEHEIRVILETARWHAVGFRLGVVDLIQTGSEPERFDYLGPDPLGAWDPVEAARRLRTDPGRPLAEALLDQRNIAGIGNVYKSEICWLRGLHPDTPVGLVPDVEGLVALAKRLMEANRDTGAQITTGDRRSGRRRWVYGRAGEPCRRCGTPILNRSGGPEGTRVTYWCRHCQEMP